MSGRKKELIERLESYERNDNFGATPIIDDSRDPLPNIEGMRAISGRFCNLDDVGYSRRMEGSQIESDNMYILPF